MGVTSGSRGCIADSLHTATIFVLALAVIFSQRLALKEENGSFHYGFGKIEAVVTGSIAFLIACGGAVLIWNSIQHLVNASQYGPPYPSALLMALVSILANVVLARYLRCAGTQLKMRSLLSSAWAHGENLVSSVIVFIGVLGAELGLGVMDPIAAILVVGEPRESMRPDRARFGQSLDGLLRKRLVWEESEVHRRGSGRSGTPICGADPENWT